MSSYHALVQTIDQNIVVVGFSTSFLDGNLTTFVVKLDAMNGDLLWAKVFDGLGNAQGYAVSSTSDGGFVVSGDVSEDNQRDSNSLIIKFNAAGEIENCSNVYSVIPVVTDITSDVVLGIPFSSGLNITSSFSSSIMPVDAMSIPFSSMNLSNACGGQIPGTTTLPDTEDKTLYGVLFGSLGGVVLLGVGAGVLWSAYIKQKREKESSATSVALLHSEIPLADSRTCTMGSTSTRDVDVEACPAWLRIWHGKYTQRGQEIIYYPVARKTKGCAVGFIAATQTGQRYIAKFGFPDVQQHVPEELATRSKTLQRTVLSVIAEKIAADVYAALGWGYYYVPKHRLAKLETINKFTKHNLVATGLMDCINHGRSKHEKITKGLHLLARWMKDYQDIATLSHCLRSQEDRTSRSFMDCIEEGYIPEYAQIDGKAVPILGVMEILAAARLLADTDVLGGSGKNAGYVVERDADGSPMAVRMVKIDAGESFTFSAQYDQFVQSFNPVSTSPKLSDRKNIQFGNQQVVVIKWNGLVKRQKDAFLSALKRGLSFLANENLVDFLIHRQGEFDKAISGRVLLCSNIVNTFKEKWKRYCALQTRPDVYGKMLEVRVDDFKFLSVPFNPKPYGAVTLRMEEAERLAFAEAHNL